VAVSGTVLRHSYTLCAVTKATQELQLTVAQAGFVLSLLGHDTQWVVPASFTHTPKYVPLGCWFQLQESAARATAVGAVKAPEQAAKASNGPFKKSFKPRNVASIFIPSGNGIVT
jgi:hypothetical protein